MNRTKYAVVLVAGVAMGLLSARIAWCADAPADPSAKAEVSWDESTQLAGGPGNDFGPPGPPRDGDHGRGPGSPDKGQQGRGPEACPLGAPGGPGGARGPMPGMPGMPGPRGPGDMGPMGGMPGGMPGFGLEFLKETDPEMYKVLKEDRDLEDQCRKLAMQYRRAPSDQRAKIKQQVEELVSKHFDVRQQRRSLELKHLESELQRLRETIDRRAKARKELVEKRVSDLIGKEDEVGF
jgi:hypothetical protein